MKIAKYKIKNWSDIDIKFIMTDSSEVGKESKTYGYVMKDGTIYIYKFVETLLPTDK